LQKDLLAISSDPPIQSDEDISSSVILIDDQRKRKTTLKNEPRDPWLFGILPFYSAHWKKCIIRTIILLFVGGLAILLPDISQLIEIITGITVTFNGFVMGPLCHLRVQYLEKKWVGAWWILSLLCNSIIILFGLLIGGWTVYLSIIKLIHFTPKSHCNTTNITNTTFF